MSERRSPAFLVWSLAIVGGLFCSLVNQLMAHPISISSALIEVREDDVVVDLDIMLEDLVLYHSLRADGEMSYSSKELLAGAEKHRAFLLEFFSILDPTGKRLTGTIEKESFEQITEESVHQTDLMRKSVMYRIRYPFEEAKPQFLTFLQTFGGPNSALPAVMDVSVWHRDRSEAAFQLNYSRSHSLKFDWNRAYENKKPTFAELRKKRKEEFQANLGISSYSGLYSFLYVTRFEVRHEVLIPFLTLERWVSVPRKDPDFLEVDEQMAAKEGIEQFLRTNCLAWIDENAVQGKLTRLSFFSLDIADFALNADPRRLSVHQARVGVIWTFPSRTTPKKARISWTAFSEYAPFLSSVVLIGNEPPKRHFYHAMEQSYDWAGELVCSKTEPVPVSRSLSDDGERKAALQELLGNVYKAFDFREDEDVYDALSNSVRGELLREVYLRVKRSLLLAEQGGTLSHASQIEVLSAEPAPSKAKHEYNVKWQVTSVSEHWGHIHTKTTEFKAKIKLVQDSGFWKLETFQLLDEKTIQFETSIRGNDSAS